jgi:hypothetical protein
MCMTYPRLGDIWPFREATVPPELASLPVDLFLADPKGSSISAAQWTVTDDPGNAPRAGYALWLLQRDGACELARWQPTSGEWKTVRRFPVPQGDFACSIIELHGILLGKISDGAALSNRPNALLQLEQREMKTYRLLSKVLSVISIIVLFYAVRRGVENQAIEPFLLIFALAAGIGLIAVCLRARRKTLSEEGLIRVREQFQFE